MVKNLDITNQFPQSLGATLNRGTTVHEATMLVSLTPAAGAKVSERRLKHDEAVFPARHKASLYSKWRRR